MNMRQVNVIDVDDWDDLVAETYNKPYNFQQQDGCKPRHTFYFTVPIHPSDYTNDYVPEIINGSEMGVSFKAWLERDPNMPINEKHDFCRVMWWERHFYPHVSMIVDDLHTKGLLPTGSYGIEIDW